MIADSLYAKYISQRSGFKVLEDKTGFIIYKITNDECFIVDMFVEDFFRQKGKGKELVDTLSDLARFEKCTFVSAHIHLFDNNANNTLHAALHTGFKVVRAENGILTIIKNLVV